VQSSEAGTRFYFLNNCPKSNKVAQYTTDNDHARRNKREDSWNFSESNI